MSIQQRLAIFYGRLWMSIDPFPPARMFHTPNPEPVFERNPVLQYIKNTRMNRLADLYEIEVAEITKIAIPMWLSFL